MQRPLTDRQSKVLEFIKAYVAKNGFAPTSREIQQNFCFSSQTSAVVYLGILEDKGWIVRQPHSARAIKILEPA